MLINFLFKLQLQNQCLTWEDYYEDVQYPTISYRISRNSIDQVEIEEATTNVYIYRCLFTNCSSKSRGGVLSFRKDNGKLLIEYSIFEECNCKNFGGAVYSSGSCDCVINSICSYKCYASNYGQFISAYLADDKKNYVISSSICSTYEIYGNESPIYLIHGYKKCESVNISNYNVSSHSAIYYWYANTISNITYCSIVSNNAVNSICVYLITSSSTYTIESCNIINNSQQAEYFGTIYCSEATDIKHSNIIDNCAEYLFYISSTTVTVEDTYIEHETTNIGLSNTNGIIDKTVKIKLEFINCIRLVNRFRITSDVYYYVFFP